MSTQLRGLVIGAGIVLGVAYALSPLTVLFALAMIGLLVAAGWGLPADERRAVWMVLGAAVTLRLIVLAVWFLSPHDGQISQLFWDGDGRYLTLRGLWIRNLWMGAPFHPAWLDEAFQRAYGWTSYLYVIAYVQYLTGPAPYGIHLFNVAIFSTTAVLLYRLARFAYGSQAALLGLVILMFLPTPLMWSVSAMKESLYVFLQACAILAAVMIFRADKVAHKAFAVAALVIAVGLNRDVREGALMVSGLGLAAGLLGTVMSKSRVLAVVVALCLPLVAYKAVNTPAVEARIMTELKSGAVQHIGHVHTEGNSYRVLDQRFYSAPYPTTASINTMTPIEGARFAVRALIAFVVVPLPWQLRSWQELIFLPQQLVWYFLAGFALFGVVAGLRRNAVVTSFLAGFAVAGGVAIALHSGNIGTMVRHRDTIVPFVVWLGALGAVDVLAWVVSLGGAVRNEFALENLSLERGQRAID